MDLATGAWGDRRAFGAHPLLEIGHEVHGVALAHSPACLSVGAVDHALQVSTTSVEWLRSTPLRGIALGLAVQRLMLTELLEQNYGEQARARPAARRRVGRRRCLRDLLAVSAGELLADRLDHPSTGAAPPRASW